MPILPINQIITKEIVIDGNTSPFEIILLPAFAVPLVGDIGNTGTFVSHLKMERLSFLTLILNSVGGTPGAQATIDVKLVMFYSGGSSTEFNLISRTASLPFTVSGTIFMRSDMFYVKTLGSHISLKISFSNMTGVTGKCDIGVEMLWERMLTGE